MGNADDIDGTISLIRECGKRVGVAISLDTPVSRLSDDLLRKVDMVLVMTVYPGFGGQKYLEKCTEKIAEVRRRSDSLGLNMDIEVDGGIDRETISTVINAGANVIVMGSSIFHGDITGNMRYFKKVLEI